MKVWRSDLIELLVVTDGNFSLVEDKLEPIYNGGAEIKYADFIAFRMGRIHDEAGQVKAWTFGAGLNLTIPGLGNLPFDMAYIPSSEGLALFTALQRRGVPSRLLYFPDEGHWVLKPANRKLWWDTVLGWLERWLQPA